MFDQSRRNHCGGPHPTEKFFKQHIKEKGYNQPPFNQSNNKHNECNGSKTNTQFRCGSENHFIANFPKPDTLDKKVHWNKENTKTCAYRSKKIDKTLENSTYQREPQEIHSSMARMSYNVEIPKINQGDSS